MIELPFPPATLSGHAKGHWRGKAAVTAKHREWARAATLAAKASAPAGTGDIRVSVTFYPPNRRGDRVNFPNRMKPYFDGIAEALKVNDSRFLPAFHFAEPVKGAGKVVVVLA
jgi:NAD(P)H-hydrate repair Nnr-like enzyme with NAD(P)H-hydrate dehydratase domain